MPTSRVHGECARSSDVWDPALEQPRAKRGQNDHQPLRISTNTAKRLPMQHTLATNEPTLR